MTNFNSKKPTAVGVVMDAKTHQALKDSIAHWKENLAAEMPGEATAGTLSCALCRLFWGRNCRGCPVSKKTGKTHCMQSPYRDAFKALMNWVEADAPATPPRDWLAARNAFRDACRAEIAFLERLLPEGAD